MNPRIVNGSRTHLVNQLIFFDEQYTDFIHHYFPEQGTKRANMEKMIRKYAGMLETLLEQSDTDLAQSLNSVTLLGSRAKVVYEEDGYEDSFTVVFPTEIDPDQNRISFLSPIGKQLLFAAAGDRMILETPVGRHDVRIEDVKFAYIGGFSKE
ncbi:GreA/GreB family elongation factor [Paenibacillus allorhizosphaerae]|uniref:Transcription elongation factor GreA n=1 Tax=Paenibacillus allorhizosphaerae TaxID=2849866 RepID=A0ABM8VT75_9BACL|nr:GreA/GreB family elongation factor [Paenibacillus allorhizosphaerae]CAG7657208.1 Transcription elongation factor GreA [Paenibacillus allorhizosphaerae]